MSKGIPSDGIVVKLARLAVVSELKKKRILKQPIAKFDSKAATGPVKNLEGSAERVTANGIAEISLSFCSILSKNIVPSDRRRDSLRRSFLQLGILTTLSSSYRPRSGFVSALPHDRWAGDPKRPAAPGVPASACGLCAAAAA